MKLMHEEKLRELLERAYQEGSEAHLAYERGENNDLCTQEGWDARRAEIINQLVESV